MTLEDIVLFQRYNIIGYDFKVDLDNGREFISCIPESPVDSQN